MFMYLLLSVLEEKWVSQSKAMLRGMSCQEKRHYESPWGLILAEAL